MNGLWFILVGAGVVAAYLINCRRWPYRKCSRCNGTGMLHSPFRGGHRTCRRCKGTARQLRLGARIQNIRP